MCSVDSVSCLSAMVLSWWLCLMGVAAAWGHEQTAQWSVVSALSVSSVEAPQNGSEFRLSARLRVTPEWTAPAGDDRLLRFQLSDVSLLTRTRRAAGADWAPAPSGSVWTQYEGGAMWARLVRGRVTAVWLRTDQPAYYTNYERALVSLFQFQVSAEAEFWNETDIAGECSGFYEQMAPLVYRKIKRTCVWAGDEAQALAEDEEGVTSRRLTRVELAPGTRDILAANLVVSEEETRAGGAEGVRARAWHRLTRDPAPRAPGHPAPPAARHSAEPPAPPLPAASLLPDYSEQDELEHTEEAEALVPLVVGTLARVSAGSEPFVWAALRLLPDLERADTPALRRLLDHDWDHDQLLAVYRLLGLSGTLAAWRVAARALALAHDDAHHAAPTYLAALAHAHPQDAVVSALVSLCGSARAAGVRGACGGAVGGAARRAGPAARQQAVTYLLAALADCKDPALCVSAVSGAAAARCGACVVPLRRVLTATDHTHARILACGALGGMSARSLGADTMRTLERVALALDRHELIEVRGAALSAWLQVSARAAHNVGAATLQHDVTLVLHQLAQSGPAELLRLARQQLAALGEELPAARAHLHALRPAHYTHPGMSFWVERDAWCVGTARVTVLGTATARHGILRDARVALELGTHGHGHGHVTSPRTPLAALQLRTQGMHHVATERPTKEEQREWSALEPSLEHEEPSAWLGVEAWGHAAVIPLFTSQGSLAAAVWSGAGAEWTRVLRGASCPAREVRRVPSALGVLLHAHTRAVADLSVHAHAQVSLWSRSAALGAGAALCARRGHGVSARTAWGAARAQRVGGACGALRVPAAADFYADVAVCVRPVLQPLTIRWESEVFGSWGGAVSRRAHRSRVVHAARCTGLGADNELQCRALAGQDEPEHEHDLARLEALAM